MTGYENAQTRPLRNILELLAENQDARGVPGSLPRSPIAKGAAYFARTFEGKHGAREYLVYVPSHRSDKAALVVMLHGCGQTSLDFAVGTRMNLLAEIHGFVVAYPCQALDANRMRCWNWYKHEHQRRDSGEPSIVAGITRRMMLDFDIDPERIYVAGMSSGGAMAAILTSTYPELYAAAGIHSGLPYGCASNLESALSAMRGNVIGQEKNNSTAPAEAVRTIVFHGTADSKVHPVNSDRIFAQVSNMSSTSSARLVGEQRGRRYVRTSIFDGRCAPQAEHWLVEGLGHAWSGGSAEASHTDSSGPDASAEIIRFFFEGQLDPVFAPVRNDLHCFQEHLTCMM
ncbi:extracellular catalytic domain type 1 short-chain-length polyhydroxyalkanoate depolymerase [Methylocystis rosea]|uniref:extracellular catalytic domain type 1 short-chain-length polyhydroxyalkanoate depolymerase n=1 Tax=Methylocystis rosea TaxID=173366 RepID=UPI0003673FEA|nr:PHB depolymerase family esterase [Methylocystis rosea]